MHLHTCCRVTSPVAVPSTIIEEKLSAVEFRVTVPVLLRFPAAVRELVSLTVREPPELTVKFPWAKMPEVTSTRAKSVTIFFHWLID